MLQQTQVATVIPYFRRWMQLFPTIDALAAAAEGDVLKAWEGLGYYSRARNLHKAAKAVVHDHHGQFPQTAETLRDLPGVGPYTAGAVASIAFNQKAPLVDGNVIRVLSRLYGYADDPRSREGTKWMWNRAAELVPDHRPGDFNSALMELGATICTPKNPQCLLCPVAAACVAREKGLQSQIPPPKAAKVTPHFDRNVFCIQNRDGLYLLEQRPSSGRWAGMWQFMTRDTTEPWPLPKEKFEAIGEVAHALTHRRYTYHVWTASAPKTFHLPPDRPTAWVNLSSLEKYALPKPHLRVVELLK